MKNLATYMREYVTEYSRQHPGFFERSRHHFSSRTKWQTSAYYYHSGTDCCAYWSPCIAVKGVWVPRQQVIQPIYGEHDQNVTKHISRLNKSLNKAAHKVVTQPDQRESNQFPNSRENKLKLIEYDESGKENLWRLPITCDVEIFPEVISLYDQIMAVKNDPEYPSARA